ncbi:stalk domain-containing protein [Paenibacillus fonticola]|uniref:stalk domain-containing protein n=1 Tax=Paenibacillus fonticola TaxID=379896 RepID=UPI00036EE837|nr:stalk domain-containing protein [Paenibacillus fonticola]
MKKWMSITAAFLLGVVVTLSAGDVSAQIKSLIGKKVTGEYEMVVNGKTLSEKGAIIDGRANVPARAFSEALGADVQVSGKTIYVTTDDAQANDGAGNETAGASPAGNSGSSNKYIGSTKSSLEELKDSIENNILKPTLEGKEELSGHLKRAENNKDAEGIEYYKERIAEYDEILKKANEDLRLVNEALQLLNK